MSAVRELLVKGLELERGDRVQIIDDSVALGGYVMQYAAGKTGTVLGMYYSNLWIEMDEPHATWFTGKGALDHMKLTPADLDQAKFGAKHYLPGPGSKAFYLRLDSAADDNVAIDG